MLKQIKKAIETKILSFEIVRQFAAMKASQNIFFTYEEFCDAVNEAVKEQGQNWPCRVEKYAPKMSAAEVRAVFMSKVGPLRNIPWVRNKIEKLSRDCDGMPNTNFLAETVTVEKGRQQDEVILYYSTFVEKWWAINPEHLDWRLSVKEIIRHEYRHVEQLKELRKRGGYNYVLCALDAHMRVNLIDYKKDPMEADAYANEKFAPSDQSDIEVAVDAIIANF